MIMNNEEVQARLESPLNLINRLRELGRNDKIAAMPVIDVSSSKHSAVVPELPPSIDELMDNFQDKVKLAGIKTAATDTLKTAIDVLGSRLSEAREPERLSKIAGDMMKVIDTINGDRREARNERPVIIFKPMLVNELSFGPIIHVNE